MATITGTSGSDSFTGTSGSDKINAGGGSDILYYSLTLNSNATNDIYTGGAGIDMVVLQFTYDQWSNAANQQQLTNYFNWLNAVKKNSAGEISNGLSSDFTFTFGSSTLKIQMMEQLGVMVDGRWLGGDFSVYNRVNPEANDDTATMDEDPQADGNPDGGDVDNVNFIKNTININVLNSDNPGESDSVPSLVRDLQMIGSGPAYGTVTLVKVNPADPSTWIFQYTMNSAEFQYLRSGETATDSFQYQVTDMSGLSDTATVTITIVGSDDAAYIGNATFVDLTEDQDVDNAGFLKVSGTIAISDPDHDQNGFNTSIADRLENKGYLVLQADGQYQYSIENSIVQNLGEGEQWIDMFTISSLDSTIKKITFVTTGVDDPTVISGDIAGLVKEKGSSTDGIPTVSGMLVANDADGTSNKFLVVQNNVSTYGKFSVAEDGSWTYTLDNTNSAVDALNEKTYFNQADSSNLARYALTDYFWVESEDGVRQKVSITIEGSDDEVVIGDPVFTKLTEDSGVDVNGNLILFGNIFIKDVDGPLVEIFSPDVYSKEENKGFMSLSEDGSYSYLVNNESIQYLSAGEKHTDYFDAYTSLGTKKTFSFTITGTNDAAVIGDLQSNQLTEDLNPDADNMLSLTGTLTISDVDIGEAMFSTIVQSATGNVGMLTMSSDGAYLYKIDNSKIQYLNDGQTNEDKFTVSSADGTTKILKFLANGVTDKIAPTANSEIILVTNNSVVNIQTNFLLANDTDVDSSNSLLKVKNFSTYLDSTFLPSLTLNGSYFSFDASLLTNSSPYLFQYTVVDEANLESTVISSVSVINSGQIYLEPDFKYDISYVVGDSLASELFLGNGADIIYGIAGADKIKSFGDADIIFADDGDDDIDAGSGNDLIYAGYGNDQVYGNRSGLIMLLEGDDDAIYGEGGDDSLYGGIGSDLINGGPGNDYIYGGEGGDLLYGGADSDIFFFNEISRVNIDKIFDFNGVVSSGAGHDLIYFSTSLLIANDNQAAEDVFVSLQTKGDVATVGDSIKLIYDQQSHKLYFDSDGGDSDFRIPVIELVGSIGLFDASCISFAEF